MPLIDKLRVTGNGEKERGNDTQEVEVNRGYLQ